MIIAKVKDSGGASFFSSSRYGSREKLEFDADDLFEIPEEYKIALSKYNTTADEINGKIDTLKTQMETLETRIQLASDKILQTMINEVDDMGDLSLMDTKLKLLN